jgi:hypothetical protein
MYTRTCCSHYSPPCVYVPVMLMPMPACCETMVVPHELNASPAADTMTALVGGANDVSLSVEYLVPPSAGAPAVKVTTTGPDGTSATWDVAAPTQGYHVEEAVLTVKAGTMVTLSITDLTARVRWCEKTCC